MNVNFGRITSQDVSYRECCSIPAERGHEKKRLRTRQATFYSMGITTQNLPFWSTPLHV